MEGFIMVALLKIEVEGCNLKDYAYLELACDVFALVRDELFRRTIAERTNARHQPSVSVDMSGEVGGLQFKRGVRMSGD